MNDFRLSFNGWLTILNPNARLRITTQQGYVYEGQKTEGLNFEMTMVGFDLTTVLEKL